LALAVLHKCGEAFTEDLTRAVPVPTSKAADMDTEDNRMAAAGKIKASR
jgi:hypothetical protein